MTDAEIRPCPEFSTPRNSSLSFRNVSASSMMRQGLAASIVLNTADGVMLAAMYTLTVALLGSCAMTGRTVFRGRALLRFAGVTVLLMAATVLGARFFFARTLSPGESPYRVFVAHCRPEPMLGVLSPLHTGRRTAGLGYVSRGGTLTMDGVLEIAESNLGTDGDGSRNEFLRLARRAKELLNRR